MSVVEELLWNAHEDTQLLLKNDALGDKFNIPREVDFLLIAEDQEKAATVCNFINDNQYGRARVDESDGLHNILVQVTMPTEQNIICSVSALMLCVAHLFGIEYDGWGCELRNATQPNIQADAASPRRLT